MSQSEYEKYLRKPLIQGKTINTGSVLPPLRLRRLDLREFSTKRQRKRKKKKKKKRKKKRKEEKKKKRKEEKKKKRKM